MQTNTNQILTDLELKPQQIENVPENRAQKKHMIKIAKIVFVSKFITGSLILLSLMLFYTFLIELSPPAYNYIIFLSGDVSLLVSHPLFYYAILKHSLNSLKAALYAHTASIILKLTGILIILIEIDQQVNSSVEKLLIMVISLSAFELTQIIAFTYIAYNWVFIKDRKWIKNFMVLKKKKMMQMKECSRRTNNSARRCPNAPLSNKQQQPEIEMQIQIQS